MMWIGPRLGPVEQMSLISFLKAGHRVILHAYDDVAGVPAGVEIADGNPTVPRNAMEKLRYRDTGSYALGSNYFRFCLQKAGAGIWADTDMICLGPIGTEEHIFGWESERFINGAILRLPENSPIIADMLGVFEPGVLPEWLPAGKRIFWQIAARLGRRFTPADLPHGIAGPKGITALVTRHNLGRYAAPPPVYYPLHPRKATTIFEPGTSLDEFVREETKTIHLWNEKLGERKQERPPVDSILGQLRRLFGV